MYICHCNAITDSDIHAAVKDGVRDMNQLSSKTGCSLTCGRCETTAVQVLGEAVSSTGEVIKRVPNPGSS